MEMRPYILSPPLTPPPSSHVPNEARRQIRWGLTPIVGSRLFLAFDTLLEKSPNSITSRSTSLEDHPQWENLRLEVLRRPV